MLRFNFLRYPWLADGRQYEHRRGRSSLRSAHLGEGRLNEGWLDILLTCKRFGVLLSDVIVPELNLREALSACAVVNYHE